MGAILRQIQLEEKGQPTKDLIKAGLLNTDETLTCDGREVLEMILVSTHEEAMAKHAKIILKSRKDNC